MYEKKISDLNRQLEDERAHCKSSDEQLNLMMQLLNDGQRSIKVNNSV